MEVSQRNERDATVVSISGEVDMNTSPEVRETFLALVQKKADKVIVNLSECPYMDSSGLATLVELLQGMKKYSGKLILTGLSDHVKDVFALAKLDTIFDIRESDLEALAALRNAGSD